jgi:hypothetical protein
MSPQPAAGGVWAAGRLASGRGLGCCRGGALGGGLVGSGVEPAPRVSAREAHGSFSSGMFFSTAVSGEWAARRSGPLGEKNTRNGSRLPRVDRFVPSRPLAPQADPDPLAEQAVYFGVLLRSRPTA